MSGFHLNSYTFSFVKYVYPRSTEFHNKNADNTPNAIINLTVLHIIVVNLAASNVLTFVIRRTSVHSNDCLLYTSRCV